MSENLFLTIYEGLQKKDNSIIWRRVIKPFITTRSRSRNEFATTFCFPPRGSRSFFIIL